MVLQDNIELLSIYNELSIYITLVCNHTASFEVVHCLSTRTGDHINDFLPTWLQTFWNGSVSTSKESGKIM